MKIRVTFSLETYDFFLKLIYLKQNGPPLVLNGVIVPINGLIDGGTGVTTLVLVRTPFIAGRGPPSRISTSTEPPISLRLTYTGRTKKKHTNKQKAVNQLVT